MNSSNDQIQAIDDVTVAEYFPEFQKIFFDPCQSRQCRVLGRTYVPAHCSSPFGEAARKLQSRRLALDPASESESVAAAGARYSDDDETEISEGSEARSVGSSELLPTRPGVIVEMDHSVLERQFIEPNGIHRGSLGPRLHRALSYDEPSMRTQHQVTRQLSDSAALRRASSAYGSLDQSLLTSDQNEEVEVYSGFTTPDNSDGSTIVKRSDNFELPQPSYSNVTVDLSNAEFSVASSAGNIPSAVTDWQLSDENEFELVRMPVAADHFVSATGGLGQDQLPSVGHWETSNQSLSYQQIYEAVCELEKRVIQGLLVQLIMENNSPEFVQSVAQALLLSTADAEAVGNYS